MIEPIGARESIDYTHVRIQSANLDNVSVL
jgi:hypothetical protein